MAGAFITVIRNCPTQGIFLHLFPFCDNKSPIKIPVVYSCGANKCGQLGNASLEDVLEPSILEHLKGKRIASAR
jgi:hypothetical protein